MRLGLLCATASIALGCGRVGFDALPGGDFVDAGQPDTSDRDDRDAGDSQFCVGAGEQSCPGTTTSFGASQVADFSRMANLSPNLASPTCGNPSAGDLTVTVVATENLILRIDTSPSTGDVTLGVFDSCDGAQRFCQRSEGVTVVTDVEMVDGQELTLVVESDQPCDHLLGVRLQGI